MTHHQQNGLDGNGRALAKAAPNSSIPERDLELTRDLAEKLRKISEDLTLEKMAEVKKELSEIYDLLSNHPQLYIQNGDPGENPLLPITISSDETTFGHPTYTFEVGLGEGKELADKDISCACLIFNSISDLLDPKDKRLYTDVEEVKNLNPQSVDHGSHAMRVYARPTVDAKVDDNRFESVGPTAHFHFHRGSGDLCGPKLLSALLDEDSAIQLVILTESQTELRRAKVSQIDIFVVEEGALELSSDLYVNRTPRFVLPIPELGEKGELLIYPEDEAKAGEAIRTNDQGEADRGIVFFNGADNAWQGVKGNGKEAILINSVSIEEASLLKAKLEEITSNGEPLTIDGIRELLFYARNDLGLVDFYNKKLEAIEKEMSIPDLENPYYRVVTKPTLHKAIYVQDPFLFNGPVLQEYPNGAVLVTDGTNTWGVATEIFIRNFKKTIDGEEHPLSSIEELYPL